MDTRIFTFAPSAVTVYDTPSARAGVAVLRCVVEIVDGRARALIFDVAPDA